jgi:hypothetical protein
MTPGVKTGFHEANEAGIPAIPLRLCNDWFNDYDENRIRPWQRFEHRRRNPMPDPSPTDRRRHCKLKCRKAFIRYTETKPVGGVEALRICKENCDGQYRKRLGVGDGAEATSNEEPPQ